MISVCVKHYQDALESGVLKVSCGSTPVSHCFQRQTGSQLSPDDFQVSDLKVTVSVLQGPPSTESAAEEETGVC